MEAFIVHPSIEGDTGKTVSLKWGYANGRTGRGGMLDMFLLAQGRTICHPPSGVQTSSRVLIPLGNVELMPVQVYAWAGISFVLDIGNPFCHPPITKAVLFSVLGLSDSGYVDEGAVACGALRPSLFLYVVGNSDIMGRQTRILPG